MYTKFFGLKEKPFNLTPDPKFLYLGKNHKESYAQLLYSVKEHVGFVVLIGEVGTGKTTICRSFLNQLPDTCNIAYIFNPNLDDLELLKSLNKELGIEHRYATKKALQDVLYNYLLEQKKNDKRVIMLIDEAQNLSPSVLEQIRLLSNLETETQKLIQIILVGQPELDQMLENDSLRQLRQRISVWCRLYSLNYQEMAEYISHRMSMAGGGHLDIFSGRALREIFRFSKGTPRLINLLCDRSLLAAYSLGERTVSVKIVRKCIRDVTGRAAHISFMSRITSALAVLTSAAALWLLVSTGAFSGVFTAEAKAVVENPPSSSSAAQSAPQPGTEAALAPEVAVEDLPNSPAPVAGPAGGPPPAQPAAPKTEVFFESNGRTAAVNSVLAAWEIAEPLTRDDEARGISQVAQARKMDCLIGKMDMAQLKALNYPAVLEVTDESGRTGFVPVVAAAGEQFKTGLAADTVSQEWLEKHWNGKAYILWKDFSGGPANLKRGDRGKTVKWLQESMHRLGYIGDARNVTGVYGEKTARAVIRFQSENQLNADGQAGAVTRMLIYGLLPDYKTPRLS
ncbi:MAG: AAA family ATPase [Nitrospinae bacterium]|nr:AAA family ATPase [Nitrospinota bacterium]